MHPKLKIPSAANSIQKGIPLKLILDQQAVNQLAENLGLVYHGFDQAGFVQACMLGLAPLGLKDRADHIAAALRTYLPAIYADAAAVIHRSLTPPLQETAGNGLAVLFYMPHCSYVAKYGVDAAYNGGNDPFEASMAIQYQLTKRFSCEFSIRSFIIQDEVRTMQVLYQWMGDTDSHVRRLCSEGTRPRLPWATRIPSFVRDPSPCLPILEQLKNDPDLYVRRSVANHVGDIAKDDLPLALRLCECWLDGASKELKWVIRHALRHPSKKGDEAAMRLRRAAR